MRVVDVEVILVDPTLLVLQMRAVVAEPLFDLIHPGAMDGLMMELKAGMVGQPGFDLLALVHPQVVERDVNRGYGGVDFVV